MVGEEVEKKLYDAATMGDVATLQQLLQQDPYLLIAVSFPFSRNLLHIAAMYGQTTVVEEVLKLNPRLARISDSQKSSPLHIAAEEGHVEICQKLLAVAPEACWRRDCHDMNPVHIAVMKGHVEIVEHLLQDSPLPAMERLRRGETVLHLCVKHGQLMVLKVLVERLGELVDAIDENGDTILHLAVRSNQLETLQYLVESNKIEKPTLNSMGKTPLGILEGSPPGTTSSYSEFRRILSCFPGPSMTNIVSVPKLTDATMVVAILIATEAFQNSVSPPGGVWQDDTPLHKAGESVLAYTHPVIFKNLICANTVAFFSSLVTIFLIITGLPLTNNSFLVIALGAAGLSMSAITTSYETSITAIAPSAKGKPLHNGVLIGFIGFAVTILVIMLFFKVIRLYSYWKRKPRRQEDLTTGHLHQRILYWIFLCLETWGLLEGRS